MINKVLQHQVITLPKFEFIEAVAVEVPLHGYKILIVVVYIAPKKKIRIEDFNKIFHLHAKVLLMGDFNAKRVEWNCFSNNNRGNELIKLCLHYHLQLHAPEMPTHFPTRGRPSVIDLYISKNIRCLTEPVTFQIFSSDHNPVGIKLLAKPLFQKKLVFRDYRNARWNNFKDEIKNCIEAKFFATTRDELNNKVIEFTEVLKRAINNNIPLKNPKKWSKRNPKIILLIKIRNFFRRKWQKSYEINIQYKALMIFVQKLINSHLYKEKNNAFQKMIANIKPTELWNFSRRYKKFKTDLPPFLVNNKNVYSNIDKVNELANYFASVHASNIHMGLKYHDNLVKKRVKGFIESSLIELNEIEWTAPREVYKHIKKKNSFCFMLLILAFIINPSTYFRKCIGIINKIYIYIKYR